MKKKLYSVEVWTRKQGSFGLYEQQTVKVFAADNEEARDEARMKCRAQGLNIQNYGEVKQVNKELVT